MTSTEPVSSSSHEAAQSILVNAMDAVAEIEKHVTLDSPGVRYIVTSFRRMLDELYDDPFVVAKH